MGSASSSSRSSTPTTTQTTAPRTSRNTGFREVQFEQPEGASSARRSQASTPRGGQKTENHRRWRHGYDSMEQPESFSDLSSVAGQMQRERTMMTFSESEQPKYVSIKTWRLHACVCCTAFPQTGKIRENTNKIPGLENQGIWKKKFENYRENQEFDKRWNNSGKNQGNLLWHPMVFL